MKAFARCERLLSAFCSALAFTGAMGLLLATLITCTSIVLRLIRRMLDALLGTLMDPSWWSGIQPILGEEELVQYAVALALFTALPWVMLNKGHIRVELCKPVFPHRLNQWLDILADSVLAVIAYLLMTRQWYLIFKKPRGDDQSVLQLIGTGNVTELADRIRMSQETQILGYPLWPMHMVAQLCVVVFFLVAVFCVVRSVLALRMPAPERRTPVHSAPQ